MRNPSTICTLIFLSVASAPNSSFAADTHVITAAKAAQKIWTYALNGTTKSSSRDNPPTPVVIDDLAVGDILDIEIPQGNHGFITTKNGAEDKELVLACGEDKSTKPNAALQEINCVAGAGSKFGQTIRGGMQMVVLPTFKDETDFWCWVHKGDMLGVLKLKQ
jgi:hypothetical protein